MIEFEYWQLLLFPLFFGLGWAAARVDIRHLVKESRTLPRSYFEGLNFLLNEQPDRAIEAFVEAVKVDPQTIEIHFALGSLFRRRGETERAIRMHQNLVERDDLPQDLKLQALAELGQDYLKAGLLDGAESVFEKLRDSALAEDAKRNLLEIYQLEKDWEKAIAIASELPDFASHKEVAEYYCELAAAEMMRSRPDLAASFLQTALERNRKCVRASLLLGDLQFQQEEFAAAIASWQRIEQQDPVYLALVAKRLLDAFRKLDRREAGLQLLRGYLDHYPSLDLLDVVFQLELESGGPEAAYRLVRDELRRNPTLLGFDKLLEARLLFASPDIRPDLDLAKGIVHGYTRRLARYRCDNCGFKARQFYWRCPACGGWETYSPKRTEEFDLTP
ncbi:MAG: tetratricopeptide repeat protein [Candidatus Accumulibacter regalis]|jgi:lipopolysaccharide biosynthesis regulator YciM|uniref:Lipopolysaccharide assembly protein B n=1 Tax=Accumulibacter regalis TaxID=522306 RepID=A0A011PP84_ACCRE|nr:MULTISPECIES: lipopolysaccharide assembly protein LapB [unclassified Candidatus Accumulibacter]EXI89266.1 MAG: tetratricopeptide repeat protein [Candidatus Accumulibacter regalis]MBL8369273.1 lipopolysaccharide assembly protein LapB [Accumulibacter sp.]MBN8513698.1 lipopolysaccharide assembly protein LapB [Accumulibacter sp.]HRE69278.1 lipopolysaccharide assembly protein LapB [Accumulibacter sp.]HRE86886.1 lipopolysaccharide assembly protein LapB [Accumulibacter sp.]